MRPIDVVNLGPVMARTAGNLGIRVGLIDGLIGDHLDLADAKIAELPGSARDTGTTAIDSAYVHGTFVAGILVARRGSAAPAICPDCMLLLRPIFRGSTATTGEALVATSDELASAIMACVAAGSRIINLSLAFGQPSSEREQALEEALDYAARWGVILVAAAGNQGTIGSSAITRHPAVIPVVACDLFRKPLRASNLSDSTGRSGLTAVGDNITSLGHKDEAVTLSGTSFAAAFVTGALALLWSAFPSAATTDISEAVTQPGRGGRRSLLPPVLDAEEAFQAMSKALGK